jgi:hypothetical protein
MATLSSLVAVLMTGAVAASVTDVGTRQREQLGQSLRELIGDKPVAGGTSGWRVQVGTFRSRAAAVAKLDATARAVPELAGADAAAQSFGALTRARFVGLPDERSAAAACAKIVAGGAGCYVLPPR